MITVRMREFCKLLILLTLVVAIGWPQEDVEPDESNPQSYAQLTSRKLRRDAILKADYKKAVEESATLAKLAGELNAELEKNSSTVLSVSALKKAEEIEKLAKKIRSRLRQY